MNFGLLTGLALPWITGCLWLACAYSFDRNGHVPGDRFRLAGYGFFVGYALLYGVILALDALLDNPGFAPVVATMLALAAMAAGMLYLLRRGKAGPQRPVQAAAAGHATPGSGTRIVTWLLAAWMAAHIAFSLADVLSIPVYPWDAWLVWVYRAKAWFYSGGLAEIVGPWRWVEASTVPPYAVNAHAYPTFVSVVAYWAATSMGEWSETLVNLPGLLCAIAIGLALFGHCRGAGLSRLASVGMCYLLFSTPLFGAHVSLGGYADIWMAGFAGLGFLALITGLAGRERYPVALGLTLVALSPCVKNEGVVWILAALGLFALMTIRPRAQWLAAGILAVVTILGALTGVTYVEIPLLGGLGLMESRIHIPFLGAYPLEARNVWRDFLVNFFTLGSWNILWLLIAAALMLAGLNPRERRQRTVLGFLLIFIASQVFIFGFTEQGRWAARFTAINRLPLQLLPALLFAIALVIPNFSKRESFQGFRPPTAARPWLAPATAAVLVAMCVVIYLSAEGAPTKGRNIEPRLTFVAGTGQLVEGQLVIERFQKGYALVSSGPVDFQAEDFPVLRVNIAAEPADDEALRPALFWRQADQPSQVKRRALSDQPLQDLSGARGWSGRITEIGVVVADTGGAPPRIGGLSLEPRTPANLWRLSWQGWLTFEPWSLRSVNFIWGGAPRQPLHLPLLVLAWAVATILLARVPGMRWREPPGHVMALVLLTAWLILDVRWTLNGARQFGLAREVGLAQSDQVLLERAPDAKIVEFIARFREKHPSDQPRRILVVGNVDDYDYHMDRARYHLLPDSALTMGRLESRLMNKQLDYVLFIGDFAEKGRSWAETWQRLPMAEAWRDRLQLVDSGEMSILFLVDTE